MKQMIAVLVLISFCLAGPVAAPAADHEADRAWIEAPNVGQGTGLITVTETADDGQDEFATLGDPDCLGGGFRGTGGPASNQGPLTESVSWINTIVLFLVTIH